MVNYSREWNKQGREEGLGYLSRFSQTGGNEEGHNKINLGKDCKHALKMGRRIKIKWRDGYLFLCINA